MSAVVTITITITVDGGAVAVRQDEHPKPRSPAVGTSDSVPTAEPVEPTGNEDWAGARGLVSCELDGGKPCPNTCKRGGRCVWASDEQEAPAARHETLDELLARARNHVMTVEEIEAQRQSYVRGEMGMGDDADEAEYRRRMEAGLPLHDTPSGAPPRVEVGAVGSPAGDRVASTEIDLTPPPSLLAKRKEIEQRRAS